MKQLVLTILVLLGFQINAQDLDLQNKIQFINSKIHHTTKGERLKWMDSLTRVIRFNKDLKYDSIAKQTIDFAISLDSLNIATNQVTNLIQFQNNYLGKPEEGLKLFNTYKDKLNRGKDFSLIGMLYIIVADSYYYTDDIDRSFTFYELAKTYAIKAKDKGLLGYANLYIGYNESELGQFSKASGSLKEASRLFAKIKDTFNILGAKIALSVLYSKNAFYEEAEKERDEAIVIAEKSNNYISLRNLYFNAAEDYRRIKDPVSQITYLKKSQIENNKISNQLIIKSKILAGLVKAYAENDSLSLAEANFKMLEDYYLNNKTENNRLNYLDAKKTLYFAKGNFNEALTFGIEFLEAQKGKSNYEDILLAEEFLGNIYKSNNDINNSNIHFLNYYQTKDSISSVQNVKSLAYYQTLYETEKRDLEIVNQKASIGILNLQNKNKTHLFIFGSLLLLALFGGIISYRSFTEIKKREQVQRKFSQALIQTQEQERTRIAKDLHDGVGQQITLIKMKAQNTDQTELSGLAHNALEEVRSISKDLYPVTLAKLGLKESLEKLLLNIDKETGLIVSVEIDDVNAHFNKTDSLNLYRFIQESVTNVLKHANAKTLIVNILKQNKAVNILIKDNGQGFAVSDKAKQTSLGLKTMQERVNILKGRVTFKSKEGKGTSIIVQIPV
jgi:signal transduction histidine kinase